MSSLIKRLFLIALVLPVLCAIWRIFVYNPVLGRAPIIGVLSFSELQGLLLVAGILIFPGALLYLAANLSQRAWFAVGCCVVCIVFAIVLCTFTLSEGMAIPIIATLEVIVAVLALLVSSLLRLQQKLTRRSTALPSVAGRR